MTTGNAPVIAGHYEERSRDTAVHGAGKGQEKKICGVHTKLLFKTKMDWRGAVNKRQGKPLIIPLL